MKLISIEPTPSPNTMKLNLNTTLPPGESNNYTKNQRDLAPLIIKDLLEIDGVTGVFQVSNFIALERHPKSDWKAILASVRNVFEGKDQQEVDSNVEVVDQSFGESRVMIHVFKGIPMQLKVNDGLEERRFGLPDRFKFAAMRAQVSSENIVKERQWKDYGTRYGTLDEIGVEVVEEVSATFDQKRLDDLVEAALHKVEIEKVEQVSKKELETALKQSDWKLRFAALERMKPVESDLPILANALKDEKTSIRRLATVYLGMLESKTVLPFLIQALNDNSATVRRTAGDCLSDLGYKEAIPAMIDALKDKNKLVRWRAAMFLYEVGDDSAIEALKEADNDPEFEVSLQVKMALKRIESGEEAAGSVWAQMTNARRN
ncbi:MAG: virulence factor [Bacillaceae bacterium]|nr:virulence factor [Bacillaceae bacterium]